MPIRRRGVVGAHVSRPRADLAIGGRAVEDQAVAIVVASRSGGAKRRAALIGRAAGAQVALSFVQVGGPGQPGAALDEDRRLPRAASRRKPLGPAKSARGQCGALRNPSMAVGSVAVGGAGLGRGIRPRSGRGRALLGGAGPRFRTGADGRGAVARS